jgi:four helix bundle protein
MDASLLLRRTKNFALDNIRFFQSLPKTDEAKILGKQLLRSSTSVASNYRAACRSRSKQEFYAKICIVVEEGDEALFWLELISESGIQTNVKIELILKEAKELIRIFSATKKSTKLNMTKSSNH